MYLSVDLWGGTIYEKTKQKGCQKSFAANKSYRPTLFLPAKPDSAVIHHTIDGREVEPIQPGTIKDCKEFISKYRDVPGFEIFGNERYLHQYISSTFPNNFVFDKNEIDIVTIDIETSSEYGMPTIDEAAEEVLLITLKHKSIYYVYGVQPYTNTREDVRYCECFDEYDLLKAFLHKWEEIQPDIMTGWNINGFDIPYLYNRISKLLGKNVANRMSPEWNVVKENNVIEGMRFQKKYSLFGIQSLDYIDLYKKYTQHNRESYKLGYIAYVELGEEKLSYEEFDTLKDLYKNNWQKFVDYNIHDVYLVDRLDEKLQFIALQVNLAYLAKVNYEEVYSQLKMWDGIIYNNLKSKNIVIPLREDAADKVEKYEGAYVKDPVIGMHKWIVSFDVASLYPHCIIQWNCSPETKQKRIEVKLTDLLEQKFDTSFLNNQCLAANGVVYDMSKQGFLPQLMQQFYDLRKEYKKKASAASKKIQELKKQATPNQAEIDELSVTESVYDKMQYAYKIALNSAYGVMGNPYFRFYDTDMAEAVTISGQFVIRWAEQHINSWLQGILKTNKNYIVASDTDSLYIVFDDLVQQVFTDQSDKNKIIDFLDKICKEKIAVEFTKYFDKLAKYVGCKNKIDMKREKIADKGIWQAKKRYILNVYDSEGTRYSKPELKIMGIETQRSSTPEICRNGLKEALTIIMNRDNDALIKFAEDFRNKFYSAPIEDISFPRGVKGIEKFSDDCEMYIKGTPIHVRGTIVYNSMLEKLKLTQKYPAIAEGEKIKFVYLKEQNPVGETVIAFPTRLPKEFNLEKYVDKDLQFQKTFIDPLAAILKAINWSLEKQSTLEGLFS